LTVDTYISSETEKVRGLSPPYTVAIINFGQDELISGCLDSIWSQTERPVQIILVDNSGHLKSEAFDMDGLTLMHPDKNLGYAGGSNLAFSLCHTNYILIMNPDVFLEVDFTARILTFLEQEHQMAACGGLLLRYDFTEDKTTNLIDSAGIVGSRSGRFWDRGQGSEWTHQYTSGTVFGVSGAAAFFRVEALRTVAVNGEVFDEDMLAYKEDIDMAWRLRKGGWNSAILVEALAYHGRAAGGSDKGWRERWSERHRHSLTARRLAFKNQFLLLVKNGNARDLDFFRTLLRQLLGVSLICIFEPTVLWVVPELFRKLPRAWKKRQQRK